MLGAEGFAKILDCLRGRPTRDFDPKTEPGGDTLDITDQVTPKNFYTSGTMVEPIRDVVGDVSDPGHFKLVSVVRRPGEPESDVHFQGLQEIPQVRMVYQLMSPRFAGRPYEQRCSSISNSTPSTGCSRAGASTRGRRLPAEGRCLDGSA